MRGAGGYLTNLNRFFEDRGFCDLTFLGQGFIRITSNEKSGPGQTFKQHTEKIYI